MKLIVSDIDGTLLKSNEKKPDKSVIKMIDDVSDESCLFGFATGRSYVEVKKLFENSGKCLCVCCDGAIAVYNEKTVFEKSFAIEELKLFDKYDSVALYGKYMIYAKGNDGFLRACKKQFDSHVTSFDTVSEITEPVYKAVIYGNGIKNEEISGFNKVYKSYNLVEFVPENVDKCSSLIKILKANNIKPDSCTVFGDGDNDKMMLRSFKNSYATVWAKPSVKACANNICDNVVKKIYEIHNKGEI